jgi:YD repeat-containing protein
MKRIFQLIIVCLAIASCSKDKTTITPPPVLAEKRLTQYNSQEQPDGNSTFTYDGQGRLSSQETQSNKYTYTYGPNSIHVEYFFKPAGKVIEKTDYVLNNQGLAISATVQDISIPNKIITTHETFDYDATGHLLNWKYEYGPIPEHHEIKQTWVNDNMVEHSHTRDGQLLNTYKYTYSNIPYKLNLDLTSSVSFQFGQFGKKNKNLREGVQYFNANNVMTTSATYAYDLDAEGFPVKVTFHNNVSNVDSHNFYVYSK